LDGTGAADGIEQSRLDPMIVHELVVISIVALFLAIVLSVLYYGSARER
jgi:hypothetical protein